MKPKGCQNKLYNINRVFNKGMGQRRERVYVRSLSEKFLYLDQENEKSILIVIERKRI